MDAQQMIHVPEDVSQLGLIVSLMLKDIRFSYFLMPAFISHVIENSEKPSALERLLSMRESSHCGRTRIVRWQDPPSSIQSQTNARYFNTSSQMCRGLLPIKMQRD